MVLAEREFPLKGLRDEDAVGVPKRLLPTKGDSYARFAKPTGLWALGVPLTLSMFSMEKERELDAFIGEDVAEPERAAMGWRRPRLEWPVDNDDDRRVPTDRCGDD
jgi:hypothetical protein